MNRRKVLVAGIGRSGTTFLYEKIGNMMGRIRPTTCLYEPYLWSIRETSYPFRTSSYKYTSQQFNPEGVYVHCATPLFLDLHNKNSLHDSWQDKIFLSSSTEDVLVKEIRVNGRLSRMLVNDPDLQVILLLRNFLQTLNSSLPLFSLLGEEFHPTDYPRLCEERNLDPSSARESELLRSFYYWHEMTKASLDCVERFADRVFPLPYEWLTKNKSYYLKEIFSFIGAEVEGRYSPDELSRPSGPKTDYCYLTNEEIREFGFTDGLYRNLLKRIPHVPTRAGEFNDGHSQLQALEKRSLGFESGERQHLSAYFRNKYYLSQLEKERTSDSEKTSEIELEAQLASVQQSKLYIANRRFINRSIEYDSITSRLAKAYKPDLWVDVIIPCFNADLSRLNCALKSVVNQTHSRVHIILVDDGSSPKNLSGLKRLSKSYKNITLVVHGENRGVSSARNTGMSHSNSRFLTFLDSDDIFKATKIENELQGLLSGEYGIAYSDYLKVQKRVDLIACHSNFNRSNDELLVGFLGRTIAIPRDLLIDKQRVTCVPAFNRKLLKYEDWVHKVELLFHNKDVKWFYNSDIGTCYRISSGGLSDMTPFENVIHQLRALSVVKDIILEYQNHTVFTNSLRDILRLNYLGGDYDLESIGLDLYSIDSNLMLIDFLSRNDLFSNKP